MTGRNFNAALRGLTALGGMATLLYIGACSPSSPVLSCAEDPSLCPDDASIGDASDGPGDTATDAETSGCSIPGPATLDCNPYCPDSCAAAATHCTHISSGDFGCIEVGDKSLGTACNAATECAEGLSCFGIGDASAACHLPCVADSGCPTGHHCTVSIQFANLADPMTFCGPEIDMCTLFSDTCGAGSGCTIDGILNSNAGICADFGEGDLGELCEGPGSCGEGLHCNLACVALCGDAAGAAACDACPTGEARPLTGHDDLSFCLGPEAPAGCSMVAQDCPEPNEGCYPASGGHDCAAAGIAPIGGVCRFTNDCAPGGLCVGQVCLAFCLDRPDAPNVVRCGALCTDGAFVTLNPPIWKQGVCIGDAPVAPCDFWTPECADDGQCALTLLGPACVPSKGSGALDAPCSAQSSCDPALVCPTAGSRAGQCSTACSNDPATVADQGAASCAELCTKGAIEVVAETGIRACL